MYEDLYLNLTDEHIAIKNMVHKFAKEVLRPAAFELDKLQATEVVKSETYWNTMRQAYDLGLNKILIPEAYGGLGLDPLGIHIVLEELGWGSGGFAVSIAVSCIPSVACCIYGSHDEKLIEKFVIPFTEDKEAKFIGCWGITEPDHGSDWVGYDTLDENIYPKVIAKKDKDKWIISGQKSAWVSNGPIATHCFLFVSTNPKKGMKASGMALVPLNEVKGFSRGKALEKTGQRALPQGELYFDDVKIPEEWMIVEGEEFFCGAMDAFLATVNAAMGAMFTGVARAAFEEALKYSKERVQGGKLIIKHQTIQQMLFKMFKRVENARYMSRAAMIYNYSNFPPDLKYSILAKVTATEAAYLNANDAIQIFGGMGLTKETEVEMIWRDARASLIEDGCNETLALNAVNKLKDYDLS